jgi:hypothetical protein
VPEPDHRPGRLRHVHGRLVAHAVRAARCCVGWATRVVTAGPPTASWTPTQQALLVGLLRRSGARLDRRRHGAARRAGRRARPRADRGPEPQPSSSRAARTSGRVRHHRRPAAPHQDESDLTDDRHETYAHVLVDEARTSRRCSGGCCAAAARRRRGRSWATSAQSSWPDLDEVGRAVRDLVGTAPHREFRLSVNYRSPAEVFDLAARRWSSRTTRGPTCRAPSARPGTNPELLTTSEAPGEPTWPTSIDRPHRRGRRHGRRHRPAVAPRGAEAVLLQQRLATRMNPANLDRILFP